MPLISSIFIGLLNGASQKGDISVNFHVGETVTSLQRATLIPGGSEALLYATVSGSLGVLLPFTSREDHDFFQHLEMHMRSENPPLCGRDHLSFRSYYYPVKVNNNNVFWFVISNSQSAGVFTPKTRALHCW